MTVTFLQRTTTRGIAKEITMSALLNTHETTYLWQQVCQGSVAAFETLVSQYQAMVSAVAYNACGDLALSEDIAQETFLTAWKSRSQLREAHKLSGWLCGIARNLAHNVNRKQSSLNVRLDQVAEPATEAVDPSEAAVTQEEESLVWQSLQTIPDNYREPLILFYRENQSVAEVAQALDLSEDAVKQRLSRGRTMLRDQIAELVEGTLRRTRPGKAFTVAVISSITTLATNSSASAAGVAVGVAAKAAVPAAMNTTAALAGGLLGTAGGLAGAWVGSTLPAELAPTIVERDYMRKAGRRFFVISSLLCVGFVLPMVFLQLHLPWQWSVGLWISWAVIYTGYIITAIVRMNRQVLKLRKDNPQAEPNPNAMRQWANQWEPRNYTSSFKLLGIPLIDIHLNKHHLNEPEGISPRSAYGWIAIGDVAYGILFAFGGRACGTIALGGMTCGIVSLGGIAVGLISLGGVALGGIAIGGLAIGYQAAGGGAIAYDVAVGGGAIAWHAAYGGGALAHDIAVGGAALAAEVNTPAAKTMMNEQPLVQGMNWYVQNRTLSMVILISFVLLMLLPQMLLYKRVDSSRHAPS
jgi:RNA polymerase sigma factor (sigma-70 family)